MEMDFMIDPETDPVFNAVAVSTVAVVGVITLGMAAVVFAGLFGAREDDFLNLWVGIKSLFTP